jgi:DNA-directed RNA polymerase I subunit RPA1
LLLLNLVDKAAQRTTVRAVTNITKSFIEKKKISNEKDERYVIGTSGVNFKAAWQHDHILDIDRIGCNDIYAVLNTYGIEAARGTIVNEIRGVFGAYGITVDPRHLSVLADYMTHAGDYRACNRIGLNVSSSPWQQMSYETTCAFLSQAAVYVTTQNLWCD